MTPATTQPNRRRLRFGSLSAGIVLAVTAASVLALALAERSSVRLDLTATREHSLAPRTRTILDRMDRDVEVVVVTDDSTVAPDLRRRVRDLLDTLDRASARVRVTRINPVTDAGQAAFDALRDRVRALYAADTRDRAAAMTDAVGVAATLPGRLRGLSDALQALRANADTGRPADGDPVENAAAVARLATRALEPTIDPARSAASGPDPDPSALEDARSALIQSLNGARDRADEIARTISPVDPATARIAEAIRDDAARAGDLITGRPRSQADMVLRILESTDAVLVLSEGSSTAIPFSALFPAAATEDGAGRTLHFLGEELISTAIASLMHPVTPIVVLTHTLPGRLLDSTGVPASPAAREALGAALDRLALRGVTLAEWPVVIDSSRPALARLDTDTVDTRPIVWFCFGTEGASAQAAARYDAYAAAVRRLLEDGESVIISLAPSARPASGADDPLAVTLAGLGIDADTGRPLISRIRVADGDAYDLSRVFNAADPATPIGRAVRGLPTALTWLTPVRPAEGASGGVILSVDASADTWAEAEWLGFASAPDDRAWSSAAAPTPNPRFDDVTGPWPVAVAVEHVGAGSFAPQRVVAVGSPGWFFNRLAARSTDVDGRTVAVYPGNLELLDAAVLWTAGDDAMIATGAAARDTPRIGPISDARLALLRWLMILGMPAATLALGAVARYTILR